MNDYIKREDAIKVIVDYAVPQMYFPTGGDLEVVGECAERVLNNAPSQDVAPVRHGRWIEYGENKDGTHNMRCSKCGAGLKSKGHANSYYTKHKYRYCNNCGAKMDEEANETNGQD